MAIAPPSDHLRSGVAVRKTKRSPKKAQLPLGQRAYEQVKEQILLGRLRSGEMVNGTRLSEEFKMSRTPVHEALNLLVKEGLLQVIPRIGYIVVPVTIQDLQDVFQLRVALETLAAELAAERAKAEELELFEGIEADYQRSALSVAGDQAASLRLAVKANREFHLKIAELSGNKRLVQVIEGLLDQSQRLVAFDPRIAGDVNFAHSAQHRAILDAVKAGDRKRAREAVTAHVKEAQERILRSLMG